MLKSHLQYHSTVDGGWTKFCPTETAESAQLLLSYKIVLISVHKGLEKFT